MVLVNQLPGDDLEARVDGRRLATVDAPVAAFEIPDDGGRVEIVPAGQGARALALTGQLLIALLVVSLMLRPPGFARAADRPTPRVDPTDRPRRPAGGGA